jgi:hypothetical protein
LASAGTEEYSLDLRSTVGNVSSHSPRCQKLKR